MRKASFIYNNYTQIQVLLKEIILYCRLYQTYQLWIDEPFLHDAKLYIPALPVQYETGKLLQMFQNQTVSSSFVFIILFHFDFSILWTLFNHAIYHTKKNISPSLDLIVLQKRLALHSSHVSSAKSLCPNFSVVAIFIGRRLHKLAKLVSYPFC